MKIIFNSISYVLAFLFLYRENSYAGKTMPFDSTVTYKLLLMDANLYGKNDTEIKLCKSLMETACKRIIKRYPTNVLTKSSYKQACDILAQIDSTFTEFNFLFYTKSKDIHYDVLTLALREEFSSGIQNNSYKINYWKNKTSKCKLIDCDEYCRIYIGIAEMINLPLKVVHIPGHYYLRWYLPDGTYFSWNANDGTPHSDESTMELYSNGIRYNEKHDSNYFPKELTDNQVRGNYYVVLAGNIWDVNPKIDAFEARELYVEALKTNYVNTELFGDYTWLHIMFPKLDHFLNINELHSCIDKAILMEKDLNHYDAKACLYALQKDFATAISTSEKGLLCILDDNDKRQKAQNHLECFRKNEDCRMIK